jgi:chemotaxis protein CheD
MIATNFQSERVFLKIAEAIIVEKPTTIITDLGPCVSVVLHDPLTKTSGMCHAQLPEKMNIDIQCQDQCPAPCLRKFEPANEFRYVACSVRFLVTEFVRRKSPLSSLKVSLYGGSDMIVDSFFKIGERNILKAKQVLREYKLSPHLEDIGGQNSRRIFHDSATGITEVLIVDNC